MPRFAVAALATAAAALTAPIAAPLAAHGPEIVVERHRSLPPASPNNYTNKWWVDYQTDISEVRRELDSDLRRATDAEDRRDAHREYRREIDDARYDYEKEMNERGYRVVSFRENRYRMAMR